MILRGRAANGRVNGAYRGAIDFSPGAFSGVDAINALSLDTYLQRRRAGRVAAVVADRGAQGAGGRRAHLRGRDDEADRRLRPLSRHALAGLRRRRGRGGLDERGDRADARRGRDLQRRAGRHLLLLDLRRAHRGRREHAAGQRAAAVAEVGRRPLRRRVPAPPLGPDPDDARPGRPQARLAREGQVPRHRGRAARALAADRRGRRDRQRAGAARHGRPAARAARAVRHVGVLHLDHERRGARARGAARRPGPPTGGAEPFGSAALLRTAARGDAGRPRAAGAQERAGSTVQRRDGRQVGRRSAWRACAAAGATATP